MNLIDAYTLNAKLKEYDLHKEFRIRVIEVYGTKKGAITRVMIKAIRFRLKTEGNPAKEEMTTSHRDERPAGPSEPRRDR